MLYLLDLFGTLAFGITGAIAGARKRMDIFGVVFVAIFTAIGGGTIRDLLIGAREIFWIKDINYLFIVFISVVFVLIFIKKIEKIKNVLLLFDAVGLGVFTLVGINKALAYGVRPIIAVVMGLITAVMGGVLRDVFCNEIPLILKKEIYATACIAGAFIYFVMLKFGLSGSVVYPLTVISVILIRVIAIKKNLSLPRPELS